jgi:heptosyltransferase-3
MLGVPQAGRAPVVSFWTCADYPEFLDSTRRLVIPMTPRKLLVVKRDKVGDLLLATPMLRVLREAMPDARIELLASDYNAWVVEGSRDVDHVWTYRRTREGRRVFPRAALSQASLWLRLRAERYDVAIAANGESSPRALQRTLWIAARRTIAYAPAPLRGLTDRLEPPGAGHERDRMLALLAPLGIAAPDPPPFPAFDPSARSLEEARAWLRGRALDPARYVVLGLGARRAKKQPDTGQVLRWSEALRERHGLATVFMWTPGASDNALYPGDDAAAQAVVDAKRAHIHPYRGPLRVAAALAWLARTSVFPDSGLMHLAAASPGGVLGLFAETQVSPHPSRWGPLGRNVDCLDAARSVASLEDARVLERVERLLQRR